MLNIVTMLRLFVVTLFVCCVGYVGVIWTVANLLVPGRAQGSLIENAQGEIIGSRQAAQAFNAPQYFWPRPSAVDYNAAATGGSNLSPANPALVDRLQPLLQAHEASKDRPLPADLATASGSGLDPHITLAAALFQADRVARARGLDEGALQQWLTDHARRPGGLFGVPLVHVLETNIALDRGEVK